MIPRRNQLPVQSFISDRPMASSPTIALHGIVTQGHQVASGRSLQSPFPEGTIRLQMPHFLKAGLDLGDCYIGTLNISISPHQFKLCKPDHTIKNVRWIDSHPPENFSFVNCQLTYKGFNHSSWLYYPHPETKIMHYQPADLMEILTSEIHGITYGDKVRLAFQNDAIQFTLDHPA